MFIKDIPYPKWHKKYENEEKDSLTSWEMVMKRRVYNEISRWEIVNGSEREYLILIFKKFNLPRRYLAPTLLTTHGIKIHKSENF